MELRHLKYFIAVAEELNLSHAAKRLETSQPSLGQQIRDLEDETGIVLFNRERGRLALTPAGQFLLSRTRHMFSCLENDLQMARSISRGQSGCLVIGSCPGSDVKILPRLLPALRDEFPEMECVAHARASRDELLDLLLKREIDLALLRPPVDHPDLEAKFLFREEFMIVLSASDPRAKKSRLALKEMKDLRYLANPPASICPKVQAALTAVGIDPIAHRVNWDTKNIVIDLGVIGSGLGFTVLPDYVKYLAPSSVAVRSWAPTAPTIDLYAAYRKDNLTPGLGFALATLRQLFHNQPQKGSELAPMEFPQ